MPDEQPIRDPLERALNLEREILYHLTEPEDNQPLWTIEELEREMDQHGIIDYVRPLQRAGLLHRTSDGHVFASRATVRFVQMVGRAC
jgi:hypothetical protein